VIRTEHINLKTAFSQPMTDVFDIRSPGAWTYAAEASTVLATTTAANESNPVSGAAWTPEERPAAALGLDSVALGDA